MDELILNNKTIKIVKTSELVNNFQLEIPKFQRIPEINKVNDIVMYQLEKLKEKNKTNFLGVLSLNKLEDKYYLIDGQHRFKALKKLYEKHSHDIEIFIEIVNIENSSELKENYITLNKNTQLPDLLDIETNKVLIEEIIHHFDENYPTILLNKSTRIYRPFINFNHFQETLNYLINDIKILDSKKLIKLIEDKNENLKTWDRKNFTGISDSIYEKAVKTKFYLGLYSYSSNDKWGYEWARDIVFDFTGNKPAKTKIKKKKSIPKIIKDGCWNKHIGKEIGEVFCLVCDDEKISQNNFEAGHIISENNGGEIHEENLIPICSRCNKSIGKKNMEDWIGEFKPENMDKFMNKQYRRTNDNPEKNNKESSFKSYFWPTLTLT